MTRNQAFSAITCAVLSAQAASAQDQTVVIGMPNWPSVQASAHVLKVSLEQKLDLNVVLQEGSNRDVFEGMDAGTIHIHPEAWLPNLDGLKRQYVDGAKTIRMHPSGATGMQGMCVTEKTAARTGITELKELSTPEMAAKFDTDGDGKGEVWIGASGWGSTPIERVRAKTYGYDQTMTLEITEEDAALADVAAAEANDRNVVFFCYTPHHMFAEHDLVVLSEPAHDPKQWRIVPPSPTPGWLEKSTAGVAWDTATLHISYASALETSMPEVAAALSNVALDNDILTNMTYAISVEQQDPAAFAAQWVADNATLVDSWFAAQ